MTSVLYGGSLNYQIGNPVRFEINKLTNSVAELKKVIEVQSTEIAVLKQGASELSQLKSQVANLERMNRDIMATIAAIQSKNS